ncbi:MAG: O-antigen ligase family protein [Flavobacteriaceae bacterium]|nr:O-antigen ligase family protein [Flavobacteriaceae bacterium]
MFKIFKQNEKCSLEKIYLLFVSLSTLLPGFGAIDNNPVRWMSLGFIAILYILYNNFITKDKLKINFEKSVIVILSSIYLVFSSLISDNSSESIISIYKLIIIISVFYTCYIAVKKIDNVFIFICQIFTISIFIESAYTLLDFISINESFTGISQNRNISSSSLVFKLVFLIYLIDNSKLFSTKLVLKILEVVVLFSIILLQSRLGLISVLTIYLLYFILMKPLRKNIYISLLISSLFFLYFSSNDFQNKIEKTYSFQNLGDDDSTIQRLSFYQKSISLFNENPLYGHGLGSWKYKSLQNDNTENKKILVPYYAHNDFLQTLMEMGIIGLLIYLIFFLLLIRNILSFRNHTAFTPMIIVLVLVVYNSLINFPIHRTQEYIPFIMCCSFIFSKRVFTEKDKKSNLLTIMLMLLIPSIIIAKNEYSALKVQGILMNDYTNNKFSLDLKQIEKIGYKLPNLASNAVPISTYLSRYYFNEKKIYESIKLLNYSLSINKYDLMTKELQLKNYIFTNQNNKAYELVKDLLSEYPNNKNYSQIFQVISRDLEIKD